MSDTDRSSQSPTFNETDVALIEGLRSGAGDAEIASRIGESQEWVRERVTFLAAQFGVQGRPGLAAWEPASTSRQPPLLEPVTSARRTIPRRGIIGAAAGLAAAAAGYEWLRRDSGDPVSPASRSRGELATPSVAAAPSPTSTPAPDVASFIVEGPDWVEQLAYAPDGPIDADQGIFFMDTATGAVSGWRVRPERAAELKGIYFYETDPSGGFIRLNIRTHNGPGRHFLIERANGKTLTWEPKQISLLAVSTGGLLLFEETRDFHGEAHLGRFHIMRRTASGVERISAFELSVVGSSQGQRGVFSPDGKAVFLAHTLSGLLPTLLRIEVATGEVLKLYGANDDAGAGLKGLFRSFSPSDDGRGVVAVIDTYPLVSDGSRPRARTSMAVAFAWDGARRDFGRLSARERLSIPSEAHVSPDTTLVAYDLPVRFIPSAAMDGGELWPGVSVATAPSREADFRVRGAALTIAPMFPGYNAWLADSSGFVTRILDESGMQDVPSWRQQAVAIVSADGSSIQRLNVPPGSSLSWPDSSRGFGPIPSPDDPALLSFGGTAVFNRSNRTWLRANIPKQTQLLLNPWVRGRAEMVFALPGGAIGLPTGPSPVLMPAAVEVAPFAVGLRLVVDGAMQSTPIFSGFAAGAEVIGHIADGTELVLAELPAGELELDRRAVQFANNKTWIRVDAGVLQGWMDSEYLAWA